MNDGHNPDTVSKVGHPGAIIQVMTKQAEDRPTPSVVVPAEVAWLKERAGARVTPPPVAYASCRLAPRYEAPGIYVLQD